MKHLQEKLEPLQKRAEEGGVIKLSEIRDLYFEMKTWLEINPDETIGRMKTRMLINALELWAKLSIQHKKEALFAKKEASELVTALLAKEKSGYFSHASKIIHHVLPIFEPKTATK